MKYRGNSTEHSDFYDALLNFLDNRITSKFRMVEYSEYYQSSKVFISNGIKITKFTSIILRIEGGGRCDLFVHNRGDYKFLSSSV